VLTSQFEITVRSDAGRVFCSRSSQLPAADVTLGWSEGNRPKNPSPLRFRPFAPRRLGQSLRYLRVFGPNLGTERRVLNERTSARCESLVQGGAAANGLDHEQHEASGVHFLGFVAERTPEHARCGRTSPERPGVGAPQDSSHSVNDKAPDCTKVTGREGKHSIKLHVSSRKL